MSSKRAAYQASKSPGDEAKDDSEPHESIKLAEHVVKEGPQTVGLVGAKLILSMLFERLYGLSSGDALLYVVDAKSFKEIFKISSVVGRKVVLIASRGERSSFLLFCGVELYRQPSPGWTVRRHFSHRGCAECRLRLCKARG